MSDLKHENPDGTKRFFHMFIHSFDFKRKHVTASMGKNCCIFGFFSLQLDVKPPLIITFRLPYGTEMPIYGRGGRGDLCGYLMHGGHG